MKHNTDLTLTEAPDSLTIRTSTSRFFKIVILSALTAFANLSDSVLWILFFPVVFGTLVYALTVYIPTMRIAKWMNPSTSLFWAILIAPFLYYFSSLSPAFWIFLPVLALYFLSTNIEVERTDDGIYVSNGLVVKKLHHFSNSEIRSRDFSIFDGVMMEPFLSSADKSDVMETLKGFISESPMAIDYEMPFESPIEDSVAKNPVRKYRNIDEA